MNKSYILVKGDVSGIQNFVFNVKSEHAAKELKGRSFFVKLLIELAIYALHDKFNISTAEEILESRISTSGGNFFLKLPMNSECETKIAEVQNELTRGLNFTGLNISIAHAAYTGDYENVIKNLDKLCRETKLRFYHEDFTYFDSFPKKNTNFDTKWKSLTETLKKTNAFIITKTPKHNTSLQIKENQVLISNYEVAFNNQGNGLLLSDFLESLFPIYNSHIIEFECLSKSTAFHKFKGSGAPCQPNIDWTIMENGGNKGIEKLGILAMDVDGLGICMESIKNETDHRETDKRLRDFFNYKIQEIINDEKETYRYNKNHYGQYITADIPRFKNKIYSVTAGGDDSFFVGKWNTILDFAIEINKAFNKEFPDLTISAGMVIVDPKFPVVRFADLVGSALKNAKYQYKTKGNICLLGEVIQWEILTEVNKMRIEFKKKDITGGMLAKARLAANSLKDATVFRLEDFWKMGYYLRELDTNAKDRIMRKLLEYMTKSIKTTDELQKRNYRSILPIAARLAELDKR